MVFQQSRATKSYDSGSGKCMDNEKSLPCRCDIADSLAKEGTSMPQAYVVPLTYLKLYSRRKALVNISWRHPPAHSWYHREGPGATIHFKGDRKDQTALARLTSGHSKTLRLSRSDKKINIGTKCNVIEATPQHLLDCVALVYDDLLKRPDFVLEVMKANDAHGSDMIQIRRIRKKKIYLPEYSCYFYENACKYCP
ncbi:hypothetical protein AVEN_149439-1 [Araneus ventricosus]|uniref:Uncharacterized protein n=1 Tax=Araneus ventricosus TaxID=182803 RepID=A0A4Y2WJ04_ARAVE|nr:hypothetical protein AVEN_97438-1 [Araneus ventricosus]GBO36588.1 hypothetical protein AVEN_28502-1 [Araneus ventricosus]GBO36590.1 hypothetical protein AVEN_72515-1 [Araneus ventricosus]GBO36591.1 hypothetical protein AVEN_149439-1 [Araneus ventricosus]